MPPTNDDFANAIVLSGLSGTHGIDNVGATYEVGEPASFLGADGLCSVWFEWTSGPSAYGYDVEFDTASTPETIAYPWWDSTLEVFSGGSLGALVLVASDDDGDLQPGDPSGLGFGTSLVTFHADPSTTYKIRVDGWTDDGHGGQVNIGVLAWAAAPTAPPPPPAPTITTVTPAAQVVGRDITIVGTNLNSVTDVSFGSVSASFTYHAGTGNITATVPLSAMPATVTVADAGGAASHAFTPLWPGPWKQPADEWTNPITSPSFDGFQLWEDTWTGASYGVTYPDATYDPSTAPIDNSAKGWYVTQTWAGFSTSPPAWRIAARTRAQGVIVQDTIDTSPAAYLLPTPPSVGELAPADVYDYEYDDALYLSGDTPVGATLGPVRITVYDNHTGFSASEKAESTGTPADFAEISTSDVHVVRLDGGDYGLAGGGPAMALTEWLTGAHLRGLTEIAAFPVSGDFATSVDGGGADAGTNVSTVSQDTVATVTVDLSLVDLDAPLGSYAVAFVSDPLYADTYPTLPAPLRLDGLAYIDAIKDIDIGIPAVSALVRYRPPRYRLLYTEPQVTGIARLRQYPRDDAAGGAPRQGKTSRSVQASARQGWTNTYR